MTVDTRQTKTVARMAMTIISAEPTPEAAARWAHRAETLAAWLATEWRREQEQAQRAVFHEASAN